MAKKLTQVADVDTPRKKKKTPPEPEMVKKKKKKKVVPVDEAELHVKRKKKKKKPKPIPEEPKQPEETPAQKYARELAEEAEKKSREERAYKQLIHFKRRDLVKECILRGLPFEQVSMPTPQLAGWFTDHLDDGQDIARLTEYDAWLGKLLTDKGIMDENKVLMHPDLRYGIGGNSAEWDNKAVKNSVKSKGDTEAAKPEKEKKEPKPKREKDEKTGIYKGTKKSLTYELTAQGMKLDDIVEKVTEQFPDANEKSIGIWRKRALKAIKEKQ